MKALPDEEGIETARVSSMVDLTPSMKALPDEEGIETPSKSDHRTRESV